MDRLLDEARPEPFYLRQPAIANTVVAAIQYHAAHLEHYQRRPSPSAAGYLSTSAQTAPESPFRLFSPATQIRGDDLRSPESQFAEGFSA